MSFKSKILVDTVGLIVKDFVALLTIIMAFAQHGVTTKDGIEFVINCNNESIKNSVYEMVGSNSANIESKALPFYLSKNPDDIKFLLFRDPRNVNESEELLYNDTESIERSGLQPNQLTVFLIHGFLSNSTTGMPLVVKKAYLESRLPYNIIVVDWGKLSAPEPKQPLFAPLAYPIIVRRNIPIAYERVADFISFLISEKYATLDTIHLVGHSLGAHVAGGVGRMIAMKPESEGKMVSRITGLDPAGPLFQGVRVQRRLSYEDAEFVDIYHTAVGTLGNIIFKEGDADFFPNGGHHQPGCVDLRQPFFESDFGSCSHSFASKIFAASITKQFRACLCEPLFIDYIAGSACPGNCSKSVLAGEPCPSNAEGQFYFETSDDPQSDKKPER